MDYVLWLASWYPNTLAPFTGDFIQRHARAASLYNNIIVIHFQKDVNASITFDVKEIISSSHNLTEIIIYYHPLKTRIGFIDKIISARKYNKVYRDALKKLIKNNGKPGFAHVHVAMRAGLQALYLKRTKKISYLVTEHWSGYYKEAPNNIYNSTTLQRLVTSKILKNASLVLPVGSSLEYAIKKFTNVECRVINNVANTKYFFYKPEEKQKFRFIHPSSMSHLKNPQGIIRAAKKLAGEGLEFEILMIGNVSIENLVKESGMPDNYIFCQGEISYEEVALKMQASSSLIMFSRYESMPCVILEGLCCGLPVISTNVGSIKDVISEDNGILVESENEEELKDAMKKMILDYKFYDKKLIAENARNKFSYEVIGKQLSELYRTYSK